jgi:hypothetical protein
MDIYILRDGKEIGPFTEETTQNLLKQGSILMEDFAWHAGLPKWLPLDEVLGATQHEEPTAAPIEEPVEEAPAEKAGTPAKRAGEPATGKQKALLSYLGIHFSSELTKDQAALMVNDAMEDAKNASRLAQWNTDRLRLHPEIFSDEIQAKKESRASRYFDICQAEGEDYFTKVTKAHCQVLVGYLDVKFPDWDANEKESVKNYFFPAIAEKFPQLVKKQWKGKLRYSDGKKVAAEFKRGPAASPVVKRGTSSPLIAIGRGIVFGVIILVMFFFVKNVMNGGGKSPAPDAAKPAAQPAAAPSKPAEPPAPVAAKPEALPPIMQEKTVAAADPAAPVVPAPADPLMAAAAVPAAPVPAQPGNPADPAAAPTAPAADPAAMKPAAPGGFPPDPPFPGATPPAAPAPTPAEPVAPPNPVAPAPAAVAADPAAVQRANLKLTRPFPFQSAYGKMTLPAGTIVKFVARDGNNVRVNYMNTILTVPVASTDLAADAAPPAAVPPPAPVNTPPPAAPAAE